MGVLARDDDVTLVSKDLRAFAGPDKRGLADHLAAEAQTRAERGTVELVTDPQAVVDRVRNPDEAALAACRRLVREKSFRVLFDEALDDLLDVYTLGAQDLASLALPVRVSHAYVLSLNDLGRIDVDRAYAAGNNEALVSLVAHVRLVVILHVRTEDVPRLMALDEIWHEIRHAEDPEQPGMPVFDEDAVALGSDSHARVNLDGRFRLRRGNIAELKRPEIHFIAADEYETEANLIRE